MGRGWCGIEKSGDNTYCSDMQVSRWVCQVSGDRVGMGREWCGMGQCGVGHPVLVHGILSAVTENCGDTRTYIVVICM